MHYLVPLNLGGYTQEEGNQAKCEGDDDGENQCKFTSSRTFHGGMAVYVKRLEKRE